MGSYGPNGIYNDKGKCVRIEGDVRGVPNSRRKRPLLGSKVRKSGFKLNQRSTGR